jgi:hypothetical protein
MHRTTGEDHVGNLFVNPDAATGAKGSVVGAPWLNSVQEEIATAVEAAGIGLTPADNSQLAAAIPLLASGVSLYGNLILNPEFLVTQWQPSITSFTAPYRYTWTVVPAIYFDRWFADNGDGGGFVELLDFAPAQTAVPHNPRRYCRMRETAPHTAAGWRLGQTIENPQRFSGEDLTLDCYARVSAGTPNITARIKIHYGSGGAPSADEELGSAVLGLTTSWTRRTLTASVPDLSGKTWGTNGDAYLWVEWEIATGSTLVQADFAIPQLVIGGSAGKFSPRPDEVELAMCRRYAECSWGLDVGAANGLPAIDVGGAATVAPLGQRRWYCPSSAFPTDPTVVGDEFKTEKRRVPDMTWFNGETGARGEIRWNATDHAASGQDAASAHTGYPNVTSGSPSGDEVRAYWFADAELGIP